MQAIEVNRLIAELGRIRKIYMPLWVLGFEVPLHRIRSQLLADVERIAEAIALGASDPELAGDRSSWSVKNLAEYLPAQLDGFTDRELFQFVAALADVDAGTEDDTLEGIAAVMTGYTRKIDAMADRDGGTRWSATAVGKLLHLIRQNASISALRAGIKNASDDDLRALHADWRLSLNSVRSTLGISKARRAVDAWDVLRRIVIGLGEFALLLGLAAMRRGHVVTIHSAAHAIADHAQRLVSDRTMRDALARSFEKGVGGELEI